MNAALKAFVYRGLERACAVVGVYDGWEGLIGDDLPDTLALERHRVRLWDREAGSNLGCTRTNPSRVLRGEKRVDVSAEILRNIERLGLDALAVVGGTGHARGGQQARRPGRAHRGHPEERRPRARAHGLRHRVRLGPSNVQRRGGGLAHLRGLAQMGASGRGRGASRGAPRAVGRARGRGADDLDPRASLLARAGVPPARRATSPRKSQGRTHASVRDHRRVRGRAARGDARGARRRRARRVRRGAARRRGRALGRASAGGHRRRCAGRRARASAARRRADGARPGDGASGSRRRRSTRASIARGAR
jgi:hypothetical protein